MLNSYITGNVFVQLLMFMEVAFCRLLFLSVSARVSIYVVHDECADTTTDTSIWIYLLLSQSN